MAVKACGLNLTYADKLNSKQGGRFTSATLFSFLLVESVLVEGLDLDEFRDLEAGA